MTSLAQLLTDVDNSVGRRSETDRAVMLHRLTDLLKVGGMGLGDDHLDLFDEVIQRFAFAIETRARVELAERLAGLVKAPPGILRTLAHDEIVVARPILAGSPCLSDQTLLEVAALRGREHMLAICERKALSPVVTDMLVMRGDGPVRQAVAGNAGAAFSASATATLLDHARDDALLARVLDQRVDLPPEARRRLVDLAKEAARQRLDASLPGAATLVVGAVDRGAAAIVAAGAVLSRGYGTAAATIQSMASRRRLSETDLIYFATHDRVEETVVAIAAMCELPVRCVDQIFSEPDNDLLLVIGRARGWSWRTVHALIRLRDPARADRAAMRRAEEVFDGLKPAAAARVVQLLKIRETAGHLSCDSSVAPMVERLVPDQARRNVR